MAKFSVLLKTEVNIRFTLVEGASSPQSAIELARTDEREFQRAIDRALASLKLPGIEYMEGSGDYSAILVDEYPDEATVEGWREGSLGEPDEHWFEGDGRTPAISLPSL